MVGPGVGAWLGVWRYAQAGAGAGPVRHAGHADLGAVLGPARVEARVNWKMLKTWIMFRRTLMLMTTQILSMGTNIIGMVTMGSLVLTMGRLVLTMGRLMMNMDIQMLTIGAWMLTVDNLMTVSSLM